MLKNTALIYVKYHEMLLFQGSTSQGHVLIIERGSKGGPALQMAKITLSYPKKVIWGQRGNNPWTPPPPVLADASSKKKSYKLK